MKLTARLQLIADMVKNTEGIIADVGTDHGFIPIYLAQKFAKRKIYAIDVHKDPLQKAMDNAADYGIVDRIEFKLSDGLKACAGEKISTLIIAGMGGVLMERLLKEAESCLTNKTELILSPHGNSNLVRRIIEELGFFIKYERYIKEAGQIYVVIYAEYGKGEIYSEAEYIFGKVDKTMDKVELNELWQKELKDLKNIYEHLQRLPENPAVYQKQEEIADQIESLKELMNQI